MWDPNKRFKWRDNHSWSGKSGQTKHTGLVLVSAKGGLASANPHLANNLFSAILSSALSSLFPSHPTDAQLFWALGNLVPYHGIDYRSERATGAY